jgi:PAS domain S-box-containing protein
LTPRAFTADRIAVLELLASQAAISLENANLYAGLQRSEMELRQILDFAPQLVAVLAPDRSRLYLNQAALDYYGFVHEEWRSGDFGSFVHPEDRERFSNETRSKFSSGLRHEVEIRSLGKDGKYRWFLYRWNPCATNKGA